MLAKLPVIIKLQLLAAACNSAGGILKLFLPLFFYEIYHFDFTIIAWLMGAYGAGCIVGAYFSGVLSEYLNAQWIAGSSLLCSGVVSAAFSLVPPLTVLFLIVPLVGIFDGAFRPVNLRLITDASPRELKLPVQGLHRVVFNLGIAAAGLIVGTLVSFGYEYVFLFQGVLNVFGSLFLLSYAYKYAGALWGYTKSATTESPQEMSATACSPWRDTLFLLFIFGQLLALGIFDQMYGTFGVFLREHSNAGPEWIAYLFSMNAVLVVILQMPVTRLIDRHGMVAAARIGIVFLSCAFLLLNAGDHIGWAVLTMLVITAAELLLIPVWTLVVLARAESRQKGKYLGIFTAAWLGHSLYGPSLGMWIYGAYGGSMLWWICACVGAVVFVLHYSTVVRLERG
ncbi:MFS transporter [Pseudomonas sp. MH10]|uniref:MFS transporter n=1 Tax=Pseudomonas sp. MH10 TaxID=3048627 RepID=UPI002AC9DF99|nr:MFS transporter [Pseudomonas sp. MH10]MEB0043503.1 MFS transporter [Pseudomonas sp. MH10]WPX63264.1 MFS transporter [Pseudomonas sp. MH10]